MKRAQQRVWSWASVSLLGDTKRGRGAEVSPVCSGLVACLWPAVCLVQSQHLRSLVCLPDGDATVDCAGDGGTATPLSWPWCCSHMSSWPTGSL